MKNNLLFGLLLILFHNLFWQQDMGLNLVLFTGLIIAVHYQQNGVRQLNRTALFLGLCFVLSAASLLLVNSTLSLFVCLLSFITFMGYLKLGQASVIESSLNGIQSFIAWRKPVLPQPIWQRGQRRPVGVLYTRLAIFPVVILIFYIMLFSEGNSIFKSWSESAFGNFLNLFKDISWPYVFFIGLGILCARWAFNKGLEPLMKLSTSSNLVRNRLKKTGSFPMMGLKHEYIMTAILFAMLNVLFAVVNFIDVKWVWFQFNLPTGFSLKEFVHDGVGYLIFSLLISIGLILYFFRRNLNHYPGSGLLKSFAYLWIFQNGILAITVVLRTIHYIGFHGLAYGRIALIVFLSMVFFGLITLAVKVASRKSNTFLLRINSAFALLLFTACATLNWDGIIARVNLNHTVANEIDLDNYLRLNPQVYPYLYENLDLVEKQIRFHNNNEVRWVSYNSIEDFKKDLDNRRDRYLSERAELSAFDSWSYADQIAVEQLSKLN